MKTFAAQLNAARKAKGWSVPLLLEKSGLEIDRSSLQRKLSGDQVLTTEEAQNLADVLGCTLVWVADSDEAAAS